jgi:ribosomal peptide maturation radical SAM protein 1
MFTTKPSGMAEVLLVSMPWGAVEQPSLALGLLKALLAREAIAADIANLQLLFAEVVGLDRFEAAKNRNVMASEWVFAGGFHHRDPQEYRDYLRARGTSPSEIALWSALRDGAHEFLQQCVERVPWSRYRVVGFTTSMMQTVSSLALARALRERHPHLRFVFGGANCEGVMGRALHDCFEFVDVVVQGEPDEYIGRLFQSLLTGEEPVNFPGVCYRRGGKSVQGSAASPVMDLSRNPVPDYDDFFEQLDTVDFKHHVKTMVMFESSRGCWWGEKSHCTFCALNALGMAYRSKPVSQVLNELRFLRDRYRITNFGASDNIIDRHSIDPLTAALAEQLPDITIFYDIRATVSREQLRSMRRAGMVALEAGLENLSTPTLARMKKATTGIANVRFLRRCAEVGISVLWNYLYGFPGEKREEYFQLAGAIEPWLFHLHAPDVAFPVSLQRYAPYHNEPEKYGIHNTGPIPDYTYIYDLPTDKLADLAYYFQFVYDDGYDPEPVGKLLQGIVERWREAFFGGAARLGASLRGEQVCIQDTRCGPAPPYFLDFALSRAYRLCESPVRAGQLARTLRRDHPAAYLQCRGDVAAMIERLDELKLLFREGEKVVAIAVPEREDFWLKAHKEEPASVRGRSGRFELEQIVS